MSCLSQPNFESTCDEAFDPDEIGWPAIVQGIRVYAQEQPPKAASELLELANLFEGGVEGGGSLRRLD